MDIIERIAALPPKKQICLGVIVALLGVYVAIAATINGENLFSREIDQLIGLATIGLGLWYAIIWYYDIKAANSNH